MTTTSRRAASALLAVAVVPAVVTTARAADASAAGDYISFSPVAGGFTLAANGKAAPLFVSGDDFPGVVRVVDDLRDDVERVTGARPTVSAGTPSSGDVVLVGTAAAIADGDLTRRVPVLAAPGTEIGHLATSLNTMLGQLEQAFADRAASEGRMRAFVSDVSHELRTPLFGIKGSTELYRMGAMPDRADVDQTMRRIDREATRLTALTEDLLLLARLDEAPEGQLDRAPMDLRTLANDARHNLRALDPSRRVELTGPSGLGAPGPAPVHADEDRLRQVVTNLVGNAATYTPPGSTVRIGVGTAAGRAVLEVADEGRA